MKRLRFTLPLSLFLFSACQTAAPVRQLDLDQWQSNEQKMATESLLKALSAPETKLGSVIASPSKIEPNYFYHWQRDAALSLNVVVGLYEKANSPELKSAYEKRIEDYIAFSRQLQQTKNLSGGQEDHFLGYGEPKFNVDGTPFNGKWNRPQNDGPALQVLTLVRYIRASGSAKVLSELYSKTAAKSLLKSNLEFLAYHWKDTCYDLWEEVRGHHFYTQLVQRRALLEGAEIAQQAKDNEAAKNYRKQAQALQKEIERHFIRAKTYILTALDHVDGVDYKISQLDASVILAAQHARGSTAASLQDSYFAATDDRILSTAVELDQVFAKLYAVNDPDHFPGAEKLGNAIGRYPEDRYDGIDNSKGNPWILLTAAMAEHLYQVALDLERKGSLEITALNWQFYKSAVPDPISSGSIIKAGDPHWSSLLAGLRRRGDAYLNRVRRHAAADGGFSEEIQRDSGLPQGARDLTWNYAAILTALQLRTPMGSAQ